MDDRVTAWFCDLYHWDITGDIAVTLTANTCLSANHAGPSVLIQTNDKSVTIRANMDDNQPAVCYAIEGNGSRPSHMGPGYSDDGTMFTLNTVEHHSVCHKNRTTDYTTTIIIDHSRRHSYQPLDIFPTMEAAMGTGGGNVPLVLIRNPGGTHETERTEVCFTPLNTNGVRKVARFP